MLGKVIFDEIAIKKGFSAKIILKEVLRNKMPIALMVTI